MKGISISRRMRTLIPVFDVVARGVFWAIVAAALMIGVARGAEPNTLYVFGFEACPHCQRMKPIVNRLEKSGVPIQRIDVRHDSSGLAQVMQVQECPTFLLVRADRRVLARATGEQSEAALRGIIARGAK